MVDLTPSEIRALLWHLHVVDHAYGDQPPENDTIESARGKLERELDHPEHHGQRGITLA
jgi:DICT domain-containing protein